MSKIFELFGYSLDSTHPEAESCRSKAWCPFMDRECDGGGNRYLSAINLAKHPNLSEAFPGKDIIQAGVCSLLIRNRPWIVCPRRLLALANPAYTKVQEKIRHDILHYSGLDFSTNLRVWSEVKIKFSAKIKKNTTKNFDYTFDYVIAGQCRKALKEVSSIIGKSLSACKNIAIQNGFTLAMRNNELWVEDFPADPIVLVEIMTSSTSGGNKAKRTQISMAFEDAILYGNRHEGPGINYRQVWARMVSQLIVKSQVGLAWGGKTLWVLQDNLADYISSSTGLDLDEYLNKKSHEVNLLSFGYGNTPQENPQTGIFDLIQSKFYSGPISPGSNENESGGFVDIIKIGVPPPKEQLWRALFIKASNGLFKV